MLDNLKLKFSELFGQQSQNTFFAPGRVNLIGEHIDYNGGLVMPCAVTFGTYLLTAPNKEGIFRFHSTNFDDVLEIPLQDDYARTGKEWYNYPLGVIHNFLVGGKNVHGLDLLFYGDLPIGAGLSSSASVEVVMAYALNTLFNAGYSKLDLVKITKKVENEFIGVNSGIMDQFAVTFGEKNKALKLDCETLDYEAVECDLADHLLAIINTNKPRKLAESKYNERVSECQEALQALQSVLKIGNLCEIHTDTFNKNKDLIKNPIVQNRAKHVVEENDRVIDAAKALAAHKLDEFGVLMYASHESLKTLYEVSGVELDTIVDFCKTYKGVTGARMTGAGFGGCAIALVKKNQFEDFSKSVIDYYAAKIGYAPSVYSSEIGTGVVEL
ncbi:Galactokinase [Arcticibacter svalbardensis MN12-7]|uniref:Galactokinase n=1 Tax=Arcticibacter svalbardensis MN12-7 TaxID=1150600 RepID=R9GXC6_9SPHI|nr:galactokinase [Arcticibacter svalbardensis]EOR96416.1 Galactokinase [Arcticibacter svalbardensis MN12-7]